MYPKFWGEMKVCALYCIYDESYWLPYSVGSIYNSVSKVFFFLSDKPWYGPVREQTETKACIAGLDDPQSKFELVEGSWELETDQRNFSLGYAQVQGFDYGVIIDADEIYEAPQLDAALVYAAERSAVDCWHTKWFTYWKSLLYRIDPIEPYDPAFLIKLGSCGFVETRNPLGSKHELMPPEICLCHHLSYALPDERIRRKHIAFDSHSQSAYEGWFEKIWHGWDGDHGLKNLHPNNPPQFRSVVAQPREALPRVLHPVYDRGGLL